LVGLGNDREGKLRLCKLSSLRKRLPILTV